MLGLVHQEEVHRAKHKIEKCRQTKNTKVHNTLPINRVYFQDESTIDDLLDDAAGIRLGLTFSLSSKALEASLVLPLLTPEDWSTDLLSVPDEARF